MTVTLGGETRTYAAAELLDRKDAATVTIPNDPSYRRPMQYRAVPLAALLSGLPYRRFDVLQIAAHDGFVAEIPISLLTREDGATPWLAIEDPRQPWPNLPGKSVSGGPIYLVWQHPERSGIMSEQWVTEVGTVTGAPSAVARWPQLDAGANASPSVRRGMNAYITQCLPCHRLDGAGASTVGPDLGRPMNATLYLTDRGLRALTRDPKSVRTWPRQTMPGFSAKLLPDADLDAVILYLRSRTKG